jgi:Tol biopolymer transport system component
VYRIATLLVVLAAASAAAVDRVSLSTTGAQPNDTCRFPAVSANGRFVAFVSRASNLVENDTNGESDVFVRDLQTGATTRVSVATGGGELNSASESPSLSGDGRYVAFVSFADNAVANDTNGVGDIFVHDRLTGQTTRASVSSSGQQSDDFSFRPSLTPDGRFVAFDSRASNLVSGDSNEDLDVFVRDRETGTTTRASITSSGSGADGLSVDASISDDGRYVAFRSSATNLSGEISGETQAIFRHERETTTTIGVSRKDTGSLVTANRSMISGDGRLVAFDSSGVAVVGENLVKAHVYVRNVGSSSTSRVSVSNLGSPGNDSSYEPRISGDGRLVVFQSVATDLVDGDTNARQDVFMRDRVSFRTVRISQDENGIDADDHSFDATISTDGRVIAFASAATNLVADDTNGWADIFVLELAPPPNTPVGDNVLVTAGSVSVLFSTVTADGETDVTAIDPAAAGSIPGGFTLDGASRAVDITTTAAYTPPVEVCFIASTSDPVVFDGLRILHNEGGVLVDRTILPPDSPAPDFATRRVCARVDSLSPFLLVSQARCAEPAKPGRTFVCHRTGGEPGAYKKLEIASAAAPAHFAHGDVAPGSGVDCDCASRP